MKQTLINKYLAGETTVMEERELKRLLLDIPLTQLTKTERSILDLLSYTDDEEVEEDIFTVDYSEEYDKVVQSKRQSHSIKLWPWVAAACVAAMLIVFLGPPREDTTEPQIAKVEPKEKNIEEKPAIQMQESEIKVAEKPLQAPKRIRKAIIPEEAKEEPQEAKTEAISEPTNIENDLARTKDVEIPKSSRNANKEFEEFTRSLRERGELVAQRVAAHNSRQLN